MSARILLSFGLFLTLGFLAGCGEATEHAKIVPVSGLVTLDGKPLPNAHVHFQPMAQGTENPGYGSYGKTDAAGKFSLSLNAQATQAAGAVVGKHRVAITTTQDDTKYDPAVGSPDGSNPKAKAPKEIVPAKYNAESTLTFDVGSNGSDKANFDLTAK
ncbi:MAG: carboxypeptidase regulatory-like domain-containing protein [Gemmataceae bacterium]|nr:carboxypeptidase regulatory-like domain-containing protein [Gemmataceae bacterium]